MCVVSMVGDHYNEKWPWNPQDHPFRKGIPYDPPKIPDIIPEPPAVPEKIVIYPDAPPITRDEFDQLKKDVQEMKDLLRRAKKYDEENNEPDCEIEEKMKKLREIAKLVGIDLDDVLGK